MDYDVLLLIVHAWASSRHASVLGGLYRQRQCWKSRLRQGTDGVPRRSLQRFLGVLGARQDKPGPEAA